MGDERAGGAALSVGDAGAVAVEPAVREIRLIDYPVMLGRRHQQHSEGLVRELSLLLISKSISGHQAHAPQRLLDLVDMLAGRHSAELDAAQQQRDRAYAQGWTSMVLTYSVVPHAREIISSYADIMDEVDTFCRSGDMLTLSTPPDLLALRRWIVSEFLRQLDGHPPRPWVGPLG